MTIQVFPFRVNRGMDDLRLARLVERTAQQPVASNVVQLHKLKAMLDYIKARKPLDDRLQAMDQQIDGELRAMTPKEVTTALPQATAQTTAQATATAQVPNLMLPSVQSPNSTKGHDRQAEELIRMAKVIRQNVEGVQQLIRRDRAVLESTAGLLEGNQMKLGKESERLRRFQQETWITWWRLLLLVIVVLVTFMVMYLFISFTRK